MIGGSDVEFARYLRQMAKAMSNRRPAEQFIIAKSAPKNLMRNAVCPWWTLRGGGASNPLLRCQAAIISRDRGPKDAVGSSGLKAL